MLKYLYQIPHLSTGVDEAKTAEKSPNEVKSAKIQQ